MSCSRYRLSHVWLMSDLTLHPAGGRGDGWADGVYLEAGWADGGGVFECCWYLSQAKTFLLSWHYLCE